VRRALALSLLTALAGLSASGQCRCGHGHRLCPVGQAPWGVAVTPNGQYAYVTNFGDNTVSVISTATDTVIGTPIPVGVYPEDIASRRTAHMPTSPIRARTMSELSRPRPTRLSARRSASLGRPMASPSPRTASTFT